MTTVFATEPFPSEVHKTVFLMGPTPRDGDTASWRPQAVEALLAAGFDGHIFVPENRGFTFNEWHGLPSQYARQVDWEEEGLNRADIILCWLDRRLRGMVGLTTNDEYGYWKGRDPSKLVLGIPPTAEKCRYQDFYAGRLGIPTFDSLPAAAAAACRLIGDGAVRRGGECCVPLHIWRHPTFQDWHMAQSGAGHELVGGRVAWTSRANGRLFGFGFEPVVKVANEGREKGGEFVVCRPQVSAVVAHMPVGPDPMDTKVVLVREYRAAAATSDGLVWELPGGSSHNLNDKPLDVAAAELREETGLAVAPNRFNVHLPRQVAATLSAHRTSVFSVQLTPEEMAQAIKAEKSAELFGVAEDGERTTVAVRTLAQIALEGRCDWSTLGQIFQVLVPFDAATGIKNLKKRNLITV